MRVQRCHHASHEIKARDVSIIWHELLHAKRWKSRKWSSLPYRSGVNKQANISWYQVAHIKLVHVRCFRERQRHCDSLSPANNGVGVPKVKRAQSHGLERTADSCKTTTMGMMCGRSSRVDDRETKAGAKAVRRMHQRSFCANGRMHQRRSEERRVGKECA